MAGSGGISNNRGSAKLRRPNASCKQRVSVKEQRSWRLGSAKKESGFAGKAIKCSGIGQTCVFKRRKSDRKEDARSKSGFATRATKYFTIGWTYVVIR
jgi:hypothetical protein